MKAHKVYIDQLLPDGSVQEVTVDVLASCEDSALGMVFKWYDRQSHLDSERELLPDQVPADRYEVVTSDCCQSKKPGYPTLQGCDCPGCEVAGLPGPRSNTCEVSELPYGDYYDGTYE